MQTIFPAVGEKERFLWNTSLPSGTRTNFLTRDRAINHHGAHRARYGFDVNRTNDGILTSE